MREVKQTPSGSALTDLVLDLFRLNNRIVASGDKLVAELGLTSARWQVLGNIVSADRPQPVAWLARNMGVSRQNVQRIVNDLLRAQFVALTANPHHRRASLVVLTDKGQQAFDAAMRLQAPLVDALAEGLEVKDLETAHNVIKAVCRKLEQDGNADENA